MKPIKGFPGYAVTKDGRIWSQRRKIWLKYNIIKGGYLRVALYKNGKPFHKPVHHVVLETFFGSCPSGMECRHLNGNPQDNRIGNLVWGTRLENAQDRINHGNASIKLTEQEVRMIIYMCRTGLFSYKEIAEIYDIHYTTVSRIINKKRWKHIWTT